MTTISLLRTASASSKRATMPDVAGEDGGGRRDGLGGGRRLGRGHGARPGAAMSADSMVSASLRKASMSIWVSGVELGLVQGRAAGVVEAGLEGVVGAPVDVQQPHAHVGHVARPDGLALGGEVVGDLAAALANSSFMLLMVQSSAFCLSGERRASETKAARNWAARRSAAALAAAKASPSNIRGRRRLPRRSP